MSQTYFTEPRFHEAPRVSISAVLEGAESEREIEVVVVFSRSAGDAPMTGDEVDAELVDDRGKPLAAVSRPKGTLPAAGGMGVSVNARFRFRKDGQTPAELRVRYGGRTYSFQVKGAA